MPIRILLSSSAAIALAACASQNDISEAPASSEMTEADVEALASLMTDVFETAPDDPDNNIRDQRVRFKTPALEGVWLYYQLNTGEERSVYRQRVTHLTLSDDASAILQKTYRLKEPERYVDAWSKPDLLAATTQDDIEPFFEDGCEQVWKMEGDGSWRGYVDPKTCRIFSERRQKYISIEAEAELSENTYKQTERGIDSDGTVLFGTEPGEFIVLYRQ